MRRWCLVDKAYLDFISSVCHGLASDENVGKELVQNWSKVARTAINEKCEAGLTLRSFRDAPPLNVQMQ